MHEEKFASILASKSVEVLNDAALLKEIGVETVIRDKVLSETGVGYGETTASESAVIDNNSNCEVAGDTGCTSIDEGAYVTDVDGNGGNTGNGQVGVSDAGNIAVGEGCDAGGTTAGEANLAAGAVSDAGNIAVGEGCDAGGTTAGEGVAEAITSANAMKKAVALGIEAQVLTDVLNKTGVEYGDYSLSFALGCYHQCEYCYDATCKIRYNKVEDFEAWGHPLVTQDFLAKLDKEIPAKKRRIKNVMLSFAGDPFPYNPENDSKKEYFHELSFAALKKLNDAGIQCSVLTKGLLPLELADYAPKKRKGHNWYGISLVNLNNEVEYREKIETHAAPLQDRLAALKALKDKSGTCKTYISVEPFPVPSMIDGLVEKTTMTALGKDEFNGKLNYTKLQQVIRTALRRVLANDVVQTVLDNPSVQAAVENAAVSSVDKANLKKLKITNFTREIESFIREELEAAMKKELEYVLSQITWVDLVIFGRGNGVNAKKISLFTKFKGHAGYYKRMAQVVKDWGTKNKVKVYVKRKVYGIGKEDEAGNKLPKVELFV